MHSRSGNEKATLWLATSNWPLEEVKEKWKLGKISVNASISSTYDMHERRRFERAPVIFCGGKVSDGFHIMLE